MFSSNSSIKVLLFVLFFFIASDISARRKDRFDEVKYLIKTQQYEKSIEELEKVRGTKKTLSIKFYLMGLAQSRIEKYEESAKSFNTSIKFGVNVEDIYYEYGQVLYALNELKKSINQFKLSIKNNFKIYESHYYIGHIYTILENYKSAHKAFNKVVKSENVDRRLLQTCQFQLAEVRTKMVEKKKYSFQKKKKIISSKVIKLLDQAIMSDPKSQISKDIRKRKDEILIMYQLHPDLLVSGRRKNKKTFRATLTQKLTYDDNVNLVTNLPTPEASFKDSYFSKTSAYLEKINYFKQKYILMNILLFNHQIYTDRDNTEVFTNDGWDMTYSLRARYEHIVKKNPASVIFDFDYNYTSRDRLGEKNNIFFSRFFSFNIGEKFKILPWGDTTLSFRYRSLTSHDETLNSDTSNFNLIQLVSTKSKHFLMLLFSANYNRLSASPENDTDSFTFGLNYIIPEVLPKFILNLGLSYTMTDTKLQSDTRGTEKTISPSIRLTRRAFKKVQTSIFFNHTKNISLDKENFDYNKQQYGFELQFIF